ncbi:MAG: hypothetical protein GHCLOJNM_03312 [bacterium]|nr:hypothetical protein [bacterium]
MVQAAYQTHVQHSPLPILVVTEAERGYDVFSPDDPRTHFHVGGTPAAPTCTCPVFLRRSDPFHRCPHILAVFGGRGGSGQPVPEPDSLEAEERLAIQAESSFPGAETRRAIPQFPSDLTIKRSVSPDGKIDSLSVELSCPVHEADFGATVNQACMALGIQDAIVQTFLADRRGSRTQGNGNGRPPSNGNTGPQTGAYGQGGSPSNGQYRQQSNGHPVRATLVSVGGMQTKSGWRLYLLVDVSGKQYKLFGNHQQLAEHLASAGHSINPVQIYPELKFNLPCQVLLEPSKDGKYTNVAKVFPAYQEGVPY